MGRRAIWVPWDQQPQEDARLHDSLQPFAGAILNAGFASSSGPSPVTRAGGMGVFGTEGGLVFDGDGSDNIAYASTPRPYVLTVDNDFTLVVVFRRPTGGTDTGCIGGLGSTAGSGGNTLFRLIGGATTAGAVQYQVQDSSGTLLYNTESSSGGVNDAQMHCAVVALNTAVGGTLEYYIDGVARGSVSRAAAPGGVTSTTFNSVDACGSRRGGSTISASSFDVALVVPLVGVKMAAEWCLRTSRLSEVWGQLFEPRRVWVPVGAAGGPTEIEVGRADEADAALAAAAVKLLVVGHAAEASEAQAPSAVKLLAAGLAVEAGTAIAPALTKIAAVGRADEADQALAPGSTAAFEVGRADEADGALAPSLVKILAPGLCAEANAALALDLAGGFDVGMAQEADVALAPTLTKVAAMGRADQADMAMAPALVFALPVGAASEADHALAVALVKVMAAGRSDELDAAIALELDGAVVYPPPDLLTIILPAEQRILPLRAEQRIATLPPEARIIRIRS